jgi:hypothetical protein
MSHPVPGSRAWRAGRWLTYLPVAATPYLCKLPDHVLKRMQRAFAVGGALEEFADARAVPPRETSFGSG